MTYRTFTQLLSFVCLILTLSCGQKKKSDSAPEIEGPKEKPNVIIVFADDQGYGDLASHGNPYIKTPNLDAFAKESLELTNFHVGTTCAPSRAGLMTGRNGNRNNAWHTIAGCSILLEDEKTMAEVFKEGGYNTAMFGKWHLGDNYPFRPHDRGFEHALYNGGGGVQQTPDYWNNTYFDDTYFRNGEPVKLEGYCTDVWFNEAIKHIQRTEDEPFFLYLPLNAAHSPFNVPESYAKMYENEPLADYQKRFYGMISNIDENFGKLVRFLKDRKLFDNTIVIYTTDNGTAAGIKTDKDGNVTGYNAGLKGTKGSHYDGGHKVPFFISWPDGDIKKGSVNNELVANVDLLPTLAHLSGIPFEVDKPLDGANVAPVLLEGKKEDDRMLVIDTQRGQWPIKGKNSCVMTTEWRLIDGTELYNIIEDPGQKNDIAEEHPEVVKKMKAYYDQWWSSIEPEMRYAEIPLGDPKANPVTITVHDMHTDDNIPWNQVQIRQGEFAPDGYYSIKVVEDGLYQFKLYRYAPESDLALNAAADRISESYSMDELPAGRSLNFESAAVQLGDFEVKADVNMEAPFVLLEGKLEKGSYRLQSNFFTEEGAKMPAYYIEINKKSTL
ncbi:arylsulfatase [Zobellia galactanivorans]|uniref:arylsulfatase n=1 Tax=Zobellia galactanivorans (strain DSM 12802 / CCUG 47099 / CIP 106680 / NCIMB 13871 / Dsij) TaxID=63186 RepID=UPI001C072A25|nr:arylsulfatase [Zobellia galactanivorans]MBU3025627.1 arylsulfatase [Zobellia galactanivorans]